MKLSEAELRKIIETYWFPTLPIVRGVTLTELINLFWLQFLQL